MFNSALTFEIELWADRISKQWYTVSGCSAKWNKYNTLQITMIFLQNQEYVKTSKAIAY